MTEDDWVPVAGFPGYSVNPLGQVRADLTGRVLTTRVNQSGLAYVGLSRNERQHIRSLPRLVAKAFIPSPNPDIFDTPINMDGDRTNCRVDNIVWRPRWYARRYNSQFEDRYHNPIDRPVRAKETGEEFPDSFQAACRYGLLEIEVVLSILNHTLAWPSYQEFEVID